MEAEAIYSYITQQRQLAGVILGIGIVGAAVGGFCVALGPSPFIRGIGIGLLILSPLFFYFGISLPGQLESQKTIWTQSILRLSTDCSTIIEELKVLVSGINKLAWLYGGFVFCGLIVAASWQDDWLGGIGLGLSTLFFVALVIEQLSRRFATVLLLALGDSP